jgi:hypothetical protein
MWQGYAQKMGCLFFVQKAMICHFGSFSGLGVACFLQPLDLQLRIGKAAGTNLERRLKTGASEFRDGVPPQEMSE